MSQKRQRTIDQLKAQGFAVVFSDRSVTRMSKGSDRRVVFLDGSQKRGQHDASGRPINGHH